MIVLWLTLALMLMSVAVSAQDADPQPLTPGMVTRTAEDIAAAQQLMAGYSPRAARAYAAPRDVSHHIVPQTIRVGYTSYIHCSDWVNAGQPVNKVVEMPFIDYVKQVLPNEWPNAWHSESLKAGAMAVKNFAWWKITLRGTQWQRPAGADVVNNTCDQYFVEGSFRPTTDAAIDQTWGWRMSRNDRIIATNFLDWAWRCDGYGWPDCMGQWDSKTMAEQGMTFDQILQFFYAPITINLMNTVTANVNNIVNGTFDAGLSNWWFWGGVGTSSTDGGIMQFNRALNTANPAVLIQDVDRHVYGGSPMLVTLRLGNTSAQNKRVTVHLHDKYSWEGPISCAFQLAPNTPLLNFIMRGASQNAWGGIRLEIVTETPDTSGVLLVDNVAVSYRPTLPAENYGCFYPRPGAPTVTTPSANAAMPPAFTLNFTHGMSNYRVGGQQQYHIQIATAPTFEAPVYDNAAALTTLTSVPLSLSVGDYHLRIRQFDGIDKWSNWSTVTPFRVRQFPDKPVIQNPISAQDGVNVTFTWTHGAHTDSYRVVLRQASDNALVLNRVFTLTEAACITSCTLTPAQMGVTLLDNVSYKWLVRGMTGDVFTNSVWATFTLDIPGVPTLTAPADGGTVSDATLQWQGVPLADRYRVVIKTGNGKTVLFNRLFDAATLCDSGTNGCTLDTVAHGFAPVSGRRYQWFVRAVRSAPPGTSTTPTRLFIYSAALLPPVNTGDPLLPVTPTTDTP